MRKFIAFLFCILLISPFIVFAKVGVGINLGKIILTEPLKAGGIYQLPPFSVINTGDEPFYYEAGVEYLEDQPQLKPPKEWFEFDPSLFHLNSGQPQLVKTKLTIPLKTQPGDYFAYVEGRVVSKEIGGAWIGVAAAAKLYFTVDPANIFQAVYYRFLALWKKYSPWDWIVAMIIAGAVFIVILRALFKRFFKLNLKISKK